MTKWVSETTEWELEEMFSALEDSVDRDLFEAFTEYIEYLEDQIHEYESEESENSFEDKGDN